MLLRRSAFPIARLLWVSCLLSSRGFAQDPCASTLSPCFDANNLELAPGPGQFATLEDADAQLSPGQLSTGVATSYLRDPVTLTAASPDPAGRAIPVVAHLWQT